MIKFVRPKVRKQCPVAGWKTQVKPYRGNAGFWYSVWKTAGRPLNNEQNSEKIVANSIDGEHENIQKHFAGIYSNIYNSIDDKEAMDKLYKEVDSKVGMKSLADVEKVTPSIIKEAVRKLNQRINI